MGMVKWLGRAPQESIFVKSWRERAKPESEKWVLMREFQRKVSSGFAGREAKKTRAARSGRREAA